MKMSDELLSLCIDRCKELGQAVLTAHEELEKWRDTPLVPIQRTQISVRLQSAINEQFRWLTEMEPD